MSKLIFIAAAGVTGWGAYRNMAVDQALSGIGSNSMNGYYLLAAALFVASAAAKLVWERE